MSPREDTSAVGAPAGLRSALGAIAEDALAKGVGGTLTTNSVLQQRLGMGAGTIQRALDILADRGALTTMSRGHLGRRIETLDIGAVWQTAALPPLRLTLSPAGAVEMDVLEDTLRAGLAALGVPCTVRHLRGGRGRIAALRTGGDDMTVISAGTFDEIDASGSQWPGSVRQLERGTYYASDRLAVAVRSRDEQGDPHVVAIDQDSYDHAVLTRAEFPPSLGFEYLDVSFPDVPAYVLAGVVDAGVWHVTRSPIPPELAGLSIRPMQRAQRVRDDLSGAVLLGGPHRPELRSVLHALDLGGLGARQRAQLAEESAKSQFLAAAARARG